MQEAQRVIGFGLPMHRAQAHVTMGSMAPLKRGQDEIARKNLVYVIEACSKRLGRAKGGVRYLAHIVGAQETYISQVASGYKDRAPGRALKSKIESKFDLEADWMDHEHDGSVVAWLVSRVPSLPYQRSIGKVRVPAGYELVPTGKLDEALRRISELESKSASKSSTRK